MKGKGKEREKEWKTDRKGKGKWKEREGQGTRKGKAGGRTGKEMETREKGWEIHEPSTLSRF
jgi:hypothetical protein